MMTGARGRVRCGRTVELARPFCILRSRYVQLQEFICPRRDARAQEGLKARSPGSRFREIACSRRRNTMGQNRRQRIAAVMAIWTALQRAIGVTRGFSGYRLSPQPRALVKE